MWRDTMGTTLELRWGSWMGGCHGYLPWQAHVERHHGHDLGIALGLLDGWMPWISSMASSCGETPWARPWNCVGALGWVDAMDIFHGKLMWRNTLGIPWNCIGALGWVEAMDIFHGKLMWRSTMGIPWNCIGALGWVDAMDIFHGKLMWRSTMGIP